MSQRIAFVTGASRGIGRATSIALARAGFDVVIAARTLKEGEGRVDQPRSDSTQGELAVVGSLESTAAAIASEGRKALPVAMDLLSRDSMDAAVEAALVEFGHVDLLMNNAVWSGPGLLDPIQAVSWEALETAMTANAFNQLYLTKLLLPRMIERGGGTILNMTSSAGQVDDPPYQVVELGMLGLAHCASKAAFHRIAPLLQAEHGKDGIRAINIDPGFTQSESMDALGLPTLGAATPDVTAAAIVWLTQHPEADEWNGRTVDSLELCARLELLEGWPPADR